MSWPCNWLKSTNSGYRIPFGLAAFVIVSLPFCSFIFCILWCILYFFERSTSTHCDVYNYLPSISAAIGNYQPQRFIWQLSILLHFLPRLCIAKHYLHYLRKNILRVPIYGAVYLVYSLNVIENFALVGLSLWTSSNDYGKLMVLVSFFKIIENLMVSEMHKYCFSVFIISSELYMGLSCYLFINSRRIDQQKGRLHHKSVKVKCVLFFINILSLALALYFFFRHNTYCEPGGKIQLFLLNYA